MSVLQTLYNVLPDLSKNERKVADYLLQFPYDIQRFTSDVIATSCGTSRSAVIRLCQKLGYKGYADFKKAVLEDKDFKNGRIMPSGSAVLSNPNTSEKKDALSIYAEGLEQLRVLENSAQLGTIADLILYAQKVITMGYEHSSYSANQLAFRLSRQDITSFSISELTLMSSSSLIVQPGDVVVIFSISGLKLYTDIVQSCHDKRVKVILITMSPQSALAKMCDHVVALPFVSHASNTYLLDDAVTFYLFIEVLIEAINKKKEVLL